MRRVTAWTLQPAKRRPDHLCNGRKPRNNREEEKKSDGHVEERRVGKKGADWLSFISNLNRTPVAGNQKGFSPSEQN